MHSWLCAAIWKLVSICICASIQIHYLLLHVHIFSPLYSNLLWKRNKNAARFLKHHRWDREITHKTKQNRDHFKDLSSLLHFFCFTSSQSVSRCNGDEVYVSIRRSSSIHVFFCKAGKGKWFCIIIHKYLIHLHSIVRGLE